eukprot:NODE_6371_length_642_cov_67.873786_g6348_i0.p2 GENE.NODE_6371_length_642_cov_67.873786_g6348_i0~~NODE_6371_length_642_cov_67.873786_g6348_i0.p2  ORF type:complete len:181 (+),score=35.02 NODE_6371_length_642_cov_67.873786_g6348_i0:68-544(+)
MSSAGKSVIQRGGKGKGKSTGGKKTGGKGKSGAPEGGKGKSGVGEAALAEMRQTRATSKGKHSAGMGKHHGVARAEDMKHHERGITRPALRRLARRGGVKRIQAAIYNDERGVLKEWLYRIIEDSLQYTDYQKRKTLRPADVVNALKRRGRFLYGFGV